MPKQIIENNRIKVVYDEFNQEDVLEELKKSFGNKTIDELNVGQKVKLFLAYIKAGRIKL